MSAGATAGTANAPRAVSAASANAPAAEKATAGASKPSFGNQERAARDPDSAENQ